MKEEYGRLMIRWLIPFASAIIVILILFFNFSVKIRQEAVETVENRLKTNAEDYALQVSKDFESVRMIGEHTAQVIELQKLTDPEAIQQLLALAAEITESQKVIYSDKDQKAVDHMGNIVNLEEMDYRELLKSNSDTGYYFIKDDQVMGSSAILLIVPMDENGGDLLIYYPLERLDDIFKSVGLSESEFVMLGASEGEIFRSNEMKSNFLIGENIWRNIDEEYQNEVSKAKVRIQNMMVGCIEVAADEEERTIVFSPIGIEDWVIIVGVNQFYVDYNENGIFSKTIGMLYQLLGVMVLFLVIFAVINFVGKVRNEENRKDLQEKADTDLLTGLNNKLATERKIKEYISKYPNSLAIMFIIDIDNFKKINDTMGHAFGDEVLRSFGKQIGANFRVTDIIGRTGGDEFTIFLKNLQSDENTIREAQKLEYFFEHFEVGEYVKYSATASIGAAVFPADGRDFGALYKSADQALYKAKKRGKNQLAFYDDRNR